MQDLSPSTSLEHADMAPLWAVAMSMWLNPILFTVPLLGFMAAMAPLNLQLAWYWVKAMPST